MTIPVFFAVQEDGSAKQKQFFNLFCSVTPLQRVKQICFTLPLSPEHLQPLGSDSADREGTKLAFSPLQCSYFATFLFPRCVRGCTCQPEVVCQGQWVLRVCVRACSICSSPSIHRTGSKKGGICLVLKADKDHSGLYLKLAKFRFLLLWLLHWSLKL